VSRAARLRELLTADRPLILAGAHDGLSARIAERAGFAGLWAGGFGICASKCLPDVGVISMHEHLTASAAIHGATSLPVLADVDDGFGDAVNVVRTVREYEAAGIAGVCLEDNQHPKRNSLYAGFERSLVDAELFARKIAAAVATRRDPAFVIVARTEALVAGLGLAEARRRAHAYARAGADVVLVHSRASSADEILEFGRAWDMDVPLAAVPSTYPGVTVDDLFAANYRLIVFANQGLRAAARAMDRAYRSMAETRSLTAVEDSVSPLREIFAIVDYEAVTRISARYIDPAAVGGEHLFQRLLAGNPHAAQDRVALRAGELALTYGELATCVRGAARQLAGAGIGAGDRVALMLRNSAEYVALFLAIVALGAIVVPIDPHAGSERFRDVVLDTTPKRCLVQADTPVHAPGPARHVARIDRASKHMTFDPPLPALTDAANLPVVAASTDACILYSAGSTGHPKGVILKHRHLLAIAETLADVLGTGPDHRDLVLAPMTHSGGWQRITATLLRGGTVVIFEGMFSIAALLDDLRRFEISGFFMTPPTVRALLRAGAEKLSKGVVGLRSVEIASAPLHADELARLGELLPGVDIFLQYGLTECSRAVILDARRYPGKRHTVGLPTRGVEVAIAGEGGELLAAGEEGEILLRAPQRAEQYWNLPQLDAERFAGGWLRTGDYGVIDGDGFVALRGRRDDMINCGGMSYFPAEVERILGDIAGLRDALVAGVPDPQRLLTQVPWIFVVPHDPGAWSIADFIKFARTRLPAHMVPRNVVVVQAIPATASGKPHRRETVRRFGPAAEGT